MPEPGCGVVFSYSKALEHLMKVGLSQIDDRRLCREAEESVEHINCPGHLTCVRLSLFGPGVQFWTDGVHFIIWIIGNTSPVVYGEDISTTASSIAVTVESEGMIDTLAMEVTETIPDSGNCSASSCSLADSVDTNSCQQPGFILAFHRKLVCTTHFY
ncbi:hypothetical protein J6590_040456 [Homalodisca vitripennis]|nr:hypothetical protein J6590_040456 [Homalodisca vitripennis]